MTSTDGIPPALELARIYAEEMDEHREVIHKLSVLRHQALLDARRQGLSVMRIAQVLGVSRQQIHRLLSRTHD
jgi:DNA-directed RNA polymerase specialized sigma24 family protein